MKSSNIMKRIGLSLSVFVLTCGQIIAQGAPPPPPPPPGGETTDHCGEGASSIGGNTECPANIDFIVPLLLMAAVVFIVFYVYKTNKRTKIV